jgi:hypothetical protein
MSAMLIPRLAAALATNESYALRARVAKYASSSSLKPLLVENTCVATTVARSD